MGNVGLFVLRRVVGAGLLVCLFGGVAVVAVDEEVEAQSYTSVARITARKLASGRVEFGLQRRLSDDSWGNRELPSTRFFPVGAEVNRWLVSSALDLGTGRVRIVARKLSSGRIEFGLQEASPNSSQWGARRLPSSRFFPTNARVGRWLYSSTLQLQIDYPPEDVGVPEDVGLVAFNDVVLPARNALTSQRDTKHIVLRVHYCGAAAVPGSYDLSQLQEEVEVLQTYVDDFFRRQSNYIEGRLRGTRISFRVGNLLMPGINWTGQTISMWSDAYYDAYQNGGQYTDPCRKEAEDRYGDYDDRVLILADLPMGGASGYALKPGGHALAATVERYSPTNQYSARVLYLETVAHEIGHAFYDWNHPWDDLNLDPFDSRADELTYTSMYPNRAMSLMSYWQFGAKMDIRSNADSGQAAYVACYQRDDSEWLDLGVDEGSCLDPPLTPRIPTDFRLTPGDRKIVASWQEPDDRGANIVDYDVQYRVIGGGAWLDWAVGNSLQTSITGLTNGTEYEVQVRAENRVGPSDYSAPISMAPRSGGVPRVVLKVGDSAQGERGADGVCTSVHCRWLHVELENFGPGPHTLACAHNGVTQAGFSRGVYDSAVVSDWPATRSCLFGYPDNEVFVVVGAEHQNGSWSGGVYSNVVVWPRGRSDGTPEDPPAGPKVVLKVGDSAQGERGADGVCTSIHCRWLHVELENFGPGPHTLACAHNGVTQAGFPRGVYDSAVVSDWPATRSCLFGYPDNEVFVVVGAEHQDGSWSGGVYSNVIVWPRGG